MWTYEDPASIVILFFTLCATYLLSHSQFLIINRDRPGCTRKLPRLGALGVTLTGWWRTILTYFLEKDTLCCDMSYTRALFSSQFSGLAGILWLL